MAHQQRRWRLASYYILATIILMITAISLGGFALWLFWPAVSLLMVSLFYLFIGAQGFQKSANGKMSIASQCLLFPYIVAARLNSRIWTRHDKKANRVVDNVYLGRFPSLSDLQSGDYNAIIDLSAELPAPAANTLPWLAFPTLDLITPDQELLINTAKQIEIASQHGPVLVCCALGYSRSSLAIIVWLVHSRRVGTSTDAIDIVKLARPGLVLKDSDYHLITSIVNNREVFS